MIITLLSDTFFEGQSNLWSNFFTVLDWVMAQFITIFSNQKLYGVSFSLPISTPEKHLVSKESYNGGGSDPISCS